MSFVQLVYYSEYRWLVGMMWKEKSRPGFRVKSWSVERLEIHSVGCRVSLGYGSWRRLNASKAIGRSQLQHQRPRPHISDHNKLPCAWKSHSLQWRPKESRVWCPQPTRPPSPECATLIPIPPRHTDHLASPEIHSPAYWHLGQGAPILCPRSRAILWCSS